MVWKRLLLAVHELLDNCHSTVYREFPQSLDHHASAATSVLLRACMVLEVGMLICNRLLVIFNFS